MKNRAKGIRFVALLVMLAAMLYASCAAAADADPIRVSSLSEPQSVISPQSVDITIKVYNSSQTDMQEKITLYDPVGAPVETYEGLKGEQSVTYKGTWDVTSDQIAKGKIIYYIEYTVQTESGPDTSVRSVPVTIQTEAAAPQLTATYSVSPASARPGQTVTIAYTLSNTGNIELRNIVIENDGVVKDDVTAVSLSVGEKVTLESSFTMGEKELVSKPTITYQASGSDKKLTISDLARKTITVAEDGLEVSVESEAAKNIYPGEKIAMTLKLKNSGNRAYTGLVATGSDGTQIASGVELAPGASYSADFELAVSSDMDFSVSVAGADTTGEPVGVVSEAIALTTQDASKALILNVLAQAETTTIYSEPAVIRIAVLVENLGQTDATTLTIKQAGTTVATIPSLPSGESRTVVFDVETSIAGKLQFAVSGKDAAGVEKTYESNIIQLTYIAPTPAPTDVPPTPTPKPTATPQPTATPKPTLGEAISAHVDPVVLYSVAGVLGALLVVLVSASAISSSRRRKRIEQGIDTFEVEPEYRARDYRGTRRKKAAKAEKAEEKKAPAKEDENVVPAAELTEEEAKRMHEASAKAERPAAEENRRRRAAQEREVPDEKTLRVAPVDERPEFIAQGQVDDSQTRIFGKLDTPEKGEEEKKEAPKAEAKPAFTPEEEDAKEQTILFSPEQVSELRKGEQKAKKAGKQELKKKKKPLFFGKKDDDDDFIDDADEFGDDDDFID